MRMTAVRQDERKPTGAKKKSAPSHSGEEADGMT